MHTDTLSLVGFKLSSMLQKIVFSLQIVKLDLHIEHQTIPLFHGLPFLQLGVLLLDIALVWLGKNTNRLLDYILESEIKDYLLLLYFFTMLQYDRFFVFSDLGRHVLMLLLCSTKLKKLYVVELQNRCVQTCDVHGIKTLQ